MHQKVTRNLPEAVSAGLATAGTMTLFVQRLPALPLSPAYLQVQVGLFFAFLGALPSVWLLATTARGQLVVVATLAAGIAAIVALATLEFGVGGFVGHAAVAVAVGVVIFGGVSRQLISAPILFKIVSVAASLLFSFGIIYVVALVWRTTVIDALLPLFVVAPAFFAIIDSLHNELTAGRTP